MKKFIVSESEKNQILKQHKDYKFILENKLEEKIFISEQIAAPTGNDLITKAKSVCPTLKNGSFVKVSENRAIKITATKDGSISAVTNKPKYVTGDVLIYKNDMTFDVYDGTKAANNSWIKKGTYKWKCAGLNAQADDFKATASDQEIKAGGWMTYDEAKLAGLNLTDRKYYDQKTINGVEYFKKAGKTIGGAGSAEQTEVIEFFNTRYGTRFQRTKDKLDANNLGGFCWAFEGEQPLSEPIWRETSAVGSAEYGVKSGMKIRLNPACFKDVRKTSKEVVSQESGFKQVDKGDCKDVLVEYMRGYENEVDTTTTAFQEMKKNAQACKRRFCSKDLKKSQGKCEGNWNLGLLGGSRKMDDIVDFFSGKENPIGTPPDRQNPYRLDNNN
jgi:hypothetical protein